MATAGTSALQEIQGIHNDLVCVFLFVFMICLNEQRGCEVESLTRGFAHADLALALHQRMKSRWRAARAASRHRGSFGREARYASNRGRRRRRGGWGGGRTTLGLVAELGKGGGHALVVACSAQEVIENLQDGTNISSGTPIAILAVWVQSA